MIELSDEDHADFVTIMSQIDAQNVPEGMKILGEQQAKLLATPSK